MIAGHIEDGYVDDLGRERRVPAATLAALDAALGVPHSHPDDQMPLVIGPVWRAEVGGVEFPMPLTNLGVMYLATERLEEAATSQEGRSGCSAQAMGRSTRTRRSRRGGSASSATRRAAGRGRGLLRRALADTEAAFEPEHADITAIRADLARVTDSTA